MDSRKKKHKNNTIGLVRRPYGIRIVLLSTRRIRGEELKLGLARSLVVFVGATKLLSPISHCIVLLLLIWVGSQLDSESIEASPSVGAALAMMISSPSSSSSLLLDCR